MRMSHLRYFLEISRTQNMTIAAKNLHISQPSLSYAVKAIEEEIGIPLLFRHSHAISLTEAGEKFAAQTERIIDSVDDLAGLMKRHANLLEGNLRLGMLWIAGYMNLFTLLNDFREHAPGVSYELVFDESDVLLQGLMNRRLHGAFVISVPALLESHSELYSIRLSTEEYMCIVPKANPLSNRDSISVKDFMNETVIMPSQKTLFHRQLSVMFEKEGITPRVLCSTSQSDIVGQLTSEGLGIGFASSTIAEKVCGDDCRVIPFCDGEKVHRMMYYVTLRELLEYPLTRSFFDFIDSHKNVNRISEQKKQGIHSHPAQ